MLGHPVPADHLPDPDADPPGVGEAASGDRRGDLVQGGFGGGQQRLPFAGALVGERRVAAGDQPLAGVVRVADLGQVDLVEQGQLQRPVGGGGRGDGGGAQRGHPAQPTEFAQRCDPRRGDHPAVADQGQLGQPEPVAHRGDGGGERGRVGGVAREHLHRHRPAVGVGEQPVVDLRGAAPAVPGVPDRRQRAAPAGHPRAGQVVERGAAGGQVPAGQLRLDRLLPVSEPVQRRVDLVGGRIGDTEVGGQGGVGPPPGGGQLARWLHHPGHHQRGRQVPFRAGRAEQAGKAEPASGAPHRGHVPMRTRAHTLHRRGRCRPQRRHRLPAQHHTHRLDRRRGQRRKVRQRLVLDLAAVPERAAQQVRLVHPLLPTRRPIVATGRRHMHRSRSARHRRSIAER